MIPKNQFTQGILTGAVVASAVVILSFFEPDRFVLPAVLATVVLVFCAPCLTFGRTEEGMKEERIYQLAAVVAGVAFGLVVVGQPTGGFIPPIAAAAQQGGSMLATGLMGWALWRAGAHSMPTLPEVLDGKLVWATSAAAGYFMLSGTLSVLALGVVLLTVHQLFRARDESLKVDLNFSQIVGVEVCILLHLMVPVLVS
mgnify:CR=1